MYWNPWSYLEHRLFGRLENDAVFNRIAPSVDKALLHAREEAELWTLAGAKRLSAVVAVVLPD